MNGIKEYIDTAIGRKAADLVLKNGKIVDVFSGTIFTADVAISDGKICGVGEYNGEKAVDVSEKYILPGLVDAHVHIESSMTVPSEYAKAVMPHGVTTVIADPHEITNVCGEDGLEFMKKAAEEIPLDINLMLPSCVPATPFEHTGAKLTAADTRRLAPDFFGIGEMMNYPGIVSGDEETLGKLVSPIIDGHAPLVSGHELDAYLSAGIKTDHECGNTREMLEKISKGMYILLREGTLSHDVARLTGGITPYNLRRCAFCTDDLFVGEIIKKGSIDNCIRKASMHGISEIDAIIMATLNACEMYGMKNKGAIAPSYRADIVVADDLSLNHISRVYKDGALVCEDGIALFDADVPDLSKVTDTVHIPDITPDFFCDEQKERFTAIELMPESIITKKVTAKKGGKLSKVCVIERHHMPGTKGIGYVTNYGITNGAIASSIGHDSHNVIVIGDNDSDMASAVNALGKSGGICVVSSGKVIALMKLDIAGLMSVKNAKDITKEHDALYEAAKELNINDSVDPFLSLSFLPLPVIPEIRITDSGLFDVTTFKFI